MTREFSAPEGMILLAALANLLLVAGATAIPALRSLLCELAGTPSRGLFWTRLTALSAAAAVLAAALLGFVLMQPGYLERLCKAMPIRIYSAEQIGKLLLLLGYSAEMASTSSTMVLSASLRLGILALGASAIIVLWAAARSRTRLFGRGASPR